MPTVSASVPTANANSRCRQSVQQPGKSQVLGNCPGREGPSETCTTRTGTRRKRSTCRSMRPGLVLFFSIAPRAPAFEATADTAGVSSEALSLDSQCTVTAQSVQNPCARPGTCIQACRYVSLYERLYGPRTEGPLADRDENRAMLISTQHRAATLWMGSLDAKFAEPAGEADGDQFHSHRRSKIIMILQPHDSVRKLKPFSLDRSRLFHARRFSCP